MNTQQQEKLKSIFEEFITTDDFKSATLLDQGHINKTYKIDSILGKPYILQKINHRIFKDPFKLDYNMGALTRLHKEASLKYEEYIFPKIFLVTEYNHLLIKRKDSIWRLMDYIDNTRSYDHIESPEIAYQAARLYGSYQHELNKTDPQYVYTTLTNLRNLSLRIRALKSAIKRDVKKRRQFAENEIAMAGEVSGIERVYQSIHRKIKIKKRITHNDTKPSNILFRNNKPEALAVIDYDTIMPGYSIYDFGDMVRSFTSSKAEDDNNFSELEIRKDLFEAISEGYFHYQKDELTQPEKEHMPDGAKIIIYMQAIRFLTDYLNGDIYYKTNYENHNLVRAGNQFALLESLFEKEQALTQILRRYTI